MGQDNSKGSLSPEVENRVKEVFKLFDTDGSNAIDKNEAVNHWKGAFGKISAKEFFNTVDVNNDGEVSLEEFIQFWKVVKASGHDEGEIMEELDKIEMCCHIEAGENMPLPLIWCSSDQR